LTIAIFAHCKYIVDPSVATPSNINIIYTFSELQFCHWQSEQPVGQWSWVIGHRSNGSKQIWMGHVAVTGQYRKTLDLWLWWGV